MFEVQEQQKQFMMIEGKLVAKKGKKKEWHATIKVLPCSFLDHLFWRKLVPWSCRQMSSPEPCGVEPRPPASSILEANIPAPVKPSDDGMAMEKGYSEGVRLGTICFSSRLSHTPHAFSAQCPGCKCTMSTLPDILQPLQPLPPFLIW